METNHDLCGKCSGCYRLLQSLRRNPTKAVVDWKLPEDLEEGCNFCSFLFQLSNQNCDCGDPASHRHISLWSGTIPLNEFVRPPVKEPVYLYFWGCIRSDWYSFEDFEKDHLNGTTGFAREVNPKLDKTDWSMIRHWVDGCMQRHESGCNSPLQLSELDLLPELEVIDCKTRKLVLWDRKAEFTALSYVWGSGTEENPTGDSPKPQQSRHILPDPFPETVIEDALVCTSKLNIPYLWVDRYCINQKPTTEKECATKHHLIQSMDKIYSTATVTIIHISGDDAYAGLPGVSNTLRIPPWPSAVIGRYKIIPVINPYDDFTTSKWARRGWTLQEGLLARRRLIFTQTRVYFQCTQSHCIENVSGEFHPYDKEDDEADANQPRVGTQAFPSSVIGSHSSSYSVEDLCNDFTSRDLTMDTDALNACLGIFSRFCTSETPEYQYCGLPFQDKSDNAFTFSLLWGCGTGYFSNNGHGIRPSRRKWGPSWSWLTWRGDMGFTREEWQEKRDQFQSCVDIQLPKRSEGRINMSTIGDYFEDIYEKNGLYQNWCPYLRLSGWVTTIRFEQAEHKPENSMECYSTSNGNSIGKAEILPTMLSEVLNKDKRLQPSASKKRRLEFASPARLLDVILIADHDGRPESCDGRFKSCLVIRRIGKEKANAYERMGTCKLYPSSFDMKTVQNISYLTVKESGGTDRKERDLECKFKTITLV